MTLHPFCRRCEGLGRTRVATVRFSDMRDSLLCFPCALTVCFQLGRRRPE